MPDMCGHSSHLHICMSAHTCILYCIVLMGWSLLPSALRPFKIYCALPNLGITRTWIYRLNFPQRPIFPGLRFFNVSEIWLGSPSLKFLPEDLCSGFLHPEKIHRPQPGLNPRTLDLEAKTLPRNHRGRLLNNEKPTIALNTNSLKCCLPSTDAIYRRGIFTHAYEISSLFHASALHWNPPVFFLKKKSLILF